VKYDSFMRSSSKALPLAAALVVSTILQPAANAGFLGNGVPSGCTLVMKLDTSKKNMTRRFTLQETATGKTFGPFHAGHGRGSDRDFDGLIDNLSSTNESKATPSGWFSVSSIYKSKENPGLGTVLLLSGMDSSNRNSSSRGILIHLGFKNNSTVNEVKSDYKVDTPEYVAAMTQKMSNPNLSLSTWSSGCISIACDVSTRHKAGVELPTKLRSKANREGSEALFVISKAYEHRQKGGKVCVYVPNRIPDKKIVAAASPAQMKTNSKRSGENRTACAQTAKTQSDTRRVLARAQVTRVKNRGKKITGTLPARTWRRDGRT
jgi:hypothetical protein